MSAKITKLLLAASTNYAAKISLQSGAVCTVAANFHICGRVLQFFANSRVSCCIANKNHVAFFWKHFATLPLFQSNSFVLFIFTFGKFVVRHVVFLLAKLLLITK